jgi:catechol 2,3-dioxygenase-like lactoylglutathione lyase family enzyme|tara:strand:- start:8598 stop:9080 length:483 start_codon:yes stop_codon:yes gene_type:complete
MKYSIIILIWIALTVSCSAIKNSQEAEVKEKTEKFGTMDLGAFSMSLNVKDLAVSKAFYENLGFQKFGGDEKMNYLIMKNGTTLIGIFQGMFEGNILTFNPGWDHEAKNIDNFMDIRKIQEVLKSKWIKLDSEADANTKGPASIILKDPDGNVILLDQHR